MTSKLQQLSRPSVVERYRALLAVSEAIISNRDLGELFRDLLTRGSELRVPLAELQVEAASAAAESRLVSLEENERRHIEAVLRHTKGVIGGKGGAAEILQLPISTLRSRMKKLGLI